MSWQKRVAAAGKRTKYENKSASVKQISTIYPEQLAAHTGIEGNFTIYMTKHPHPFLHIYSSDDSDDINIVFLSTLLIAPNMISYLRLSMMLIDIHNNFVLWVKVVMLDQIIKYVP